METFHIDQMKQGWFIGDFEPSAFRTHGVEVCARLHQQGEKWQKHFHEHSYEVNFLKEGQMTICGETICGNSIFVIAPNEIADPEFLTNCFVVTVRIPYMVGDKKEIK